MTAEDKKPHTIEVTDSSNNKPHKTQSVKITDINMPFGSMVFFMIKWVLASIPAFIILSIVGLILSMILISVFGTFMMSTFSQY